MKSKKTSYTEYAEENRGFSVVTSKKKERKKKEKKKRKKEKKKMKTNA